MTIKKRLIKPAERKRLKEEERARRLSGEDRTRPGNLPKPISKDLLKRLCAVHCTRDECCAILDITPPNFIKRLAEWGTTWEDFYAQYSASGKASLRRAQWKKALVEKNTTMQIWLGKQHLGQVDKNEIGFDPEKPVRFFRMDMGKKLDPEQSPKGKEDAS